MMGMWMPETCSAVFKRQATNLRSCCILLVDSVESMMMQRLANPKLITNVREQNAHKNTGLYVSTKTKGTALDMTNLILCGLCSPPCTVMMSYFNACNGSQNEGGKRGVGYIQKFGGETP
jgi:hypothetical protein